MICFFTFSDISCKKKKYFNKILKKNHLNFRKQLFYYILNKIKYYYMQSVCLIVMY